MKQKVDIGTFVLGERSSEQARATMAVLNGDLGSNTTANAVVGENSYPANHFEEIYRRRINHRRATGTEHPGMARAVEDLARSNAIMRLIAVELDSGHVVLFVDVEDQVVTGFFEPAVSEPGGTH